MRDTIGERLIAECPQDAQAVLDVMAHTYQTQAKGVSSPVGWINSMVNRVKCQTFDPLPGLTIAAARAERQRRETALIESDRREKQVTQQAGASPLPPAPDTPRDRYVSQEATAFFESFRAGKEKFAAPADNAGSPNDARQASPLMQQKALTQNNNTPLISSVRKLMGS